MAICFYCGREGAVFKRNVQTGYAKHNWSSYRSFGSGTTKYYANRSVCDDCIAMLELRKEKSTTLVLFLTACGLLYYLISK